MSLTKLAIIIALAWFSCRLVLSPRDLALRALVACLFFRLFAAPSTVAWLREITGGVLTPSLGKLVMNVALNASWCFLLLFFLFAAAGSTARAWREAALMLATSAGMALAVLLTPDADSAFPTRGALPVVFSAPTVAAFYLVGSAYIAYATGSAAIWAWRYATESGRRTRVGLQIAAIGLGVEAMTAVVRAVIVIIRWTGGTVPLSVAHAVDRLVPTAVLVFVVGVCWAGLSARFSEFRVWNRHRRIYHQLYPLWARLHDAFPADALDRHPNSQWLDRLSPLRMHRRFWRRLIEIRDGMVQLGPHLADAGYDAERPAHQQTAVLEEALQRQHDGVRPRGRSAVLIAAPARPDLCADIEQLLALAHALPSKPSAHQPR
ncbi:hypothetical protein SAMN05421805_10634 [Saccharopolyspora antimicrobica]|uniref:DUF6545 domain-containing protein n=1 Tax=Saccharopolyspora antimicrobica TaxID=455193 RepID=A0A1I5AWW5_9PSEU|nr:MAB_1171c family putative transporter [Saccharopolyspora antimicrobica]RKT86393.1 hypothetical protein ATL45_4760 [Saccharopolyspora antimicrobica]SFN66943.1 hypothetical protein SAMN05421805_10634 [Saccharopolyspora antimicrobica]